MKIALIQYAPVWENIDINIQTLTAKIDQLESDVDLVVLPEMFSTGFTMKPDLVSETENGKAIKWMIETAKSQNIAITGSLVISENEKYYNRLFFVFPDGNYKTYNKKHLFSLTGEENVYEPGNDKLIVNYKGWNICPLICYDLRFPVYSRIVDKAYDLLIYVASWPDQRIYAWDTLLKARAIENMSFVVAVNRSGKDALENKYSGHSQVIDYMGQFIQEPMIDEQIVIVTLQKEGLEKARNRFAFLDDADQFKIR
ncbi:nitrilase family protein [Flavobacterium sp. I3-2]|uniref:nitrilase family protein n=1 Tax=Flavobacterium sp. I3-2 TaxID=2748319 RepID=UPI0015AB95B3|nr:nitrilase family protein [Flavobacterium sp. I3-2]